MEQEKRKRWIESVKEEELKEDRMAKKVKKTGIERMWGIVEGVNLTMD